VEARGFVLGSGVALRLGVGFVAICKAGSINPGPNVERLTAPDWRGTSSNSSDRRSARAMSSCSWTTGPRSAARLPRRKR
jgi:hypothetical protein